MWRTIGKGESHLAEIVGPILKNAADVEVAYRAHAPYIELKLRFYEHDAPRQESLCNAIQTALRPWLYEVDDEDIPKLLAAKLLACRSVDLYDGATQGHLIEFLAPHLRRGLATPADVAVVTSWESHEAPAAFIEQVLDLNSDSELALAICGFDASGNWAVGLRRHDEKQIEERPPVYHGAAARSRNLMCVAALAAKFWCDRLSLRH